MCRVHHMHTTAVPVGSSDYKTVIAKHEVLQAGHEKRMEDIGKMHFREVTITPSHYGQKPYLVIFGKKLNLRRGDVDRAENAGYKVYWD